MLVFQVVPIPLLENNDYLLPVMQRPRCVRTGLAQTTHKRFGEHGNKSI